MFYKFVVRGIVQGVGFRPYIFRKAQEEGLRGYVKNIGSGVEIVVNDKEFLSKLTDLPTLADIQESTCDAVEEKYNDFRILQSSKADGETTLPADLFLCSDCLKELRDNTNRRHNYYFTTCTNCGPRFTMIEDYPYDRHTTSMKTFSMCEECEKEYTNPYDRRYHAQTIACKNCGPKLKLFLQDKNITGKNDKETLVSATELLKKNKILAIKGVGGYHLCCRATPSAVLELRRRLRREHKPFALMVNSCKNAQNIVHLSKKEEEILLGPQRPIVICKKKNREDFQIVSELDSLGIFLPYTALHYLLFDSINEPLVMTSCNNPDEPMSLEAAFGDGVLLHEREIVNRCDDSVVRVYGDNIGYLRRSRGYVPLPIFLPPTVSSTQEIVSVGAELNNTIAVVKRGKCYLSQYIGDTKKEKTKIFMEETLATFMHLTRSQPHKIIGDLHPNYTSTQYGQELAKKYSIPFIQVQHHKAHVASVAAEHNFSDYVGIAIDGLGYGEDGDIWGGEIFLVEKDTRFTHVGQLQKQPQLGDIAAQEPKKMLVGILSSFLSEEEISSLKIFEEKESKLLYKAITTGFTVYQTSSCGRILDAASALLEFCDNRTYEGRPAMVLESRILGEPYPLEPVIEEKEGKHILMTTPLFSFLVSNLSKDRGRLAATVHTYIAKGLLTIAKKTAGNKPIVCSGGVAYNAYIRNILEQEGVHFNMNIPCGDGGIAYGQSYLGLMQK